MTEYQKLQCLTEQLLDDFQKPLSPANKYMFKKLRGTITQYILKNYFGIFTRTPNRIPEDIRIIIATQCYVASTKTKNAAILKNLDQIRIYAIQIFQH